MNEKNWQAKPTKSHIIQYVINYFLVILFIGIFFFLVYTDFLRKIKENPKIQQK